MAAHAVCFITGSLKKPFYTNVSGLRVKNMDGHIYKSFDRELHDLKEDLLYVGSRVERSIANAIKALEERNSRACRAGNQ
ncbi:MAG: hypothetical protein MZU95_02980 [Desulfomicrobium escambiense]|nr:hypothetical protein [Desulfomicrobium escambiense]